MLEKRGRRWLRVIHIILIAFLMGGLLSILLISRIPGLAGKELFIANLTLYKLFNTVVTLAFYGVVTTGLMYSVFTHWGLTKHWWVVGKWVGTLTLFFLVWVWLGPSINGMVALSDAGIRNASDLNAYLSYSSQIVPAILVALAIMAFLVSITTFRPWGMREQRYELKRSTILWLTGSAVVISISFGMIGYFDLEKYRALEISSPDLKQIPDGVYQGAETYAGFVYVVEVSIENHLIKSLDILENRDSPYARYAEGIIPRILTQQSPNVDGITGATTTSKCLMKALESALEGAIQ
jgi:uncharacterized protein with FMN-binding domain